MVMDRKKALSKMKMPKNSADADADLDMVLDEVAPTDELEEPELEEGEEFAEEEEMTLELDGYSDDELLEELKRRGLSDSEPAEGEIEEENIDNDMEDELY